MTDARLNPSLGSSNGQANIKLKGPVNAGSWVATLSDGTTAVERKGQWTINPGERLPWVRLCEFAADNDLHLTSLRLNFNGRTIHMPREKFNKFSMEERSIVPEYYSVQYHIEVDDVLSGGAVQETFVDLAAHYKNFAVHFIQDVTGGTDSWVVVTDPSALAPSPRRK